MRTFVILTQKLDGCQTWVSLCYRDDWKNAIATMKFYNVQTDGRICQA